MGPLCIITLAPTLLQKCLLSTQVAFSYDWRKHLMRGLHRCLQSGRHVGVYYNFTIVSQYRSQDVVSRGLELWAAGGPRRNATGVNVLALARSAAACMHARMRQVPPSPYLDVLRRYPSCFLLSSFIFIHLPPPVPHRPLVQVRVKVSASWFPYEAGGVQYAMPVFNPTRCGLSTTPRLDRELLTLSGPGASFQRTPMTSDRRRQQRGHLLRTGLRVL